MALPEEFTMSEMLDELGISRAQARNKQITQPIAKRLREKGYVSIITRRGDTIARVYTKKRNLKAKLDDPDNFVDMDSVLSEIDGILP